MKKFVSLLMVSCLMIVSAPVVVSANLGMGDINADGVINAADVTLLRRFVAIDLAQRLTWAANNGVNLQNADILSTGTPSQADIAALRRYVAGGGFPLPPVQGRFVAITSDDGPSGGLTRGGTNATATMLYNLRDLNERPEVMCGMNGVVACVPGREGRYGFCRTPEKIPCGTQSRAHISFYVMGAGGAMGDGWNHVREEARPLMRRMLLEGHSIENHTMTHLIAHVHGRQHVVNAEIEATNTMIRQIIHGGTLPRPPGHGLEPITGGGPITDFYGNTWSDSNPYPIFSFRPNNFTMGAGFRHADTDTNQPWIFSGLDVDDWRGHTAQMKVQWILNGSRPAAQRPCQVLPGHRTPHHCSSGCNFSSVWNNYQGVLNDVDAAHGGIILIHDTATATGMSAAEFVRLVVPEMQELGYHFVTIEQLFEYMDAEWAWIDDIPNIVPGEGNGSRVNDWVIEGARRTGPGPRPHTRPTP
jgi:peptidoglycan/xylan/chitin deacetylase (PgdA/CDA1 family)